MSDLIDDIRVEVQLPPEEGDNLITNTSGKYGAWQWGMADWSTDLTSLTGSEADGIRLTAEASIATGIWSDFVPVTPGMYANARIDVLEIGNGSLDPANEPHVVTLGSKFYESDFSLISTSYTDPAAALGTLAQSSLLVPANAAYVRMVVAVNIADFPNPETGFARKDAFARFDRAMITEVTTSGTPTDMVTNLVKNGGFEYGSTGWTVGQNIASVTTGTYAGIPGRVLVGNPSAGGVTLSNGEYGYVHGSEIAIEAGATYSLRGSTLSTTPDNPISHHFISGIVLRWYDSAHKQIGAWRNYTQGQTGNFWDEVREMVTAPSNAATVGLSVFFKHVGATKTFGPETRIRANNILLARSPSPIGEYFDGDTPDTGAATYAWTGTVGNSASTRALVGAVPYVEPDEQFVNIIGGYNQFSIERDELDISTMNGTAVDPVLSPAIADALVVPGRGVRVSAYDPAIGGMRRLFTGQLGPCAVEYDPLNDGRRGKVKISITASGRESTLAQASRPAVAIDAAGLPYLALAGAGVPWVVDGDSNLVQASSVADSDNATALDQVALTRDTVGGTAWVDPYGTLRFVTALGAKSTGPATMGPADYTASGLKVSFATDRLTNSVNVTRLIRATDGSTEERVDGQVYEDGASVRRWGRHSAQLTIASTPGAVVDAEVAAQRLLDGNANPTQVVEEVSVNSADNRTHAFHDLYDLITVSASTIDAEVVRDVRVTSIKHEFTAEARPRGQGQGRWKTTYGFMADGGVASPSVQPSGGSSASANGWTTLPLRSGFSGLAGETPRYKKIGDVVYIQGRVAGSFTTSGQAVADLPDGFRPTLANLVWATVMGTGATPGRMYITNDGVLSIDMTAADTDTVSVTLSYPT